MRDRFFAAILSVFMLPGVLLAQDKPASVVSGTVVLIKVATNQILVAYKRPGDFVETISTVKVDEKTQFKNVEGLAALKINDPITVSFQELEPGTLLAQAVVKEAAEKASPQGVNLS